MSNYLKVRDLIQTGDVIAFSGRGLFSQIIKLRINCPISHVGIVVRSNDTTGLFADSVLLLESTTLTKGLDADGMDVIKGVQMRWLSQVVESYDGDVSIYQLKNYPTPENEKKMIDWLREKKFQKTAYDYKQIAYLGFKTKNLKDNENSTLFCSELVAKCLQKLGILSEDYHPSLMTPKDVLNIKIARSSIFKHPLPLK